MTDVPQFLVHKNDQSLVDFAKTMLKQCSFRKVGQYQLFDVTTDVVEDISEILIPELDTREGAIGVMTNNMPVLVEWGKASVFRLNVVIEGDPEQGQMAGNYEAFVVVDRKGNLFGHTLDYRDWTIDVECYKRIEHDEKVDLTKPMMASEDIKYVRSLSGMIVLKLMRAILDRSTEYRMSRGVRTHRERITNVPSVVTISLSKPLIVTVPGDTRGGGWKLPEHQVRGHWRTCRNSNTIWIDGHKRGDPNVKRKTVYRVVP